LTALRFSPLPFFRQSDRKDLFFPPSDSFPFLVTLEIDNCCLPCGTKGTTFLSPPCSVPFLRLHHPNLFAQGQAMPLGILPSPFFFSFCYIYSSLLNMTFSLFFSLYFCRPLLFFHEGTLSFFQFGFPLFSFPLLSGFSMFTSPLAFLRRLLVRRELHFFLWFYLFFPLSFP